jgi:sporulation protein YlmC with PRC-barrel domain
LIGKPMVTITHGEIVGKVRDVLIDPRTNEIAALVLPGKLLSRRTMVIPRHLVHVFGKDVILIKNNEPVQRDDSLEEVRSLLGVSKEMRGQPVVTQAGIRIGIVEDVMVDEDGRVVSYYLGKVNVEGPLAESRQIPLSYTRSMGPDVIIVDGTVLEPGAAGAQEGLERFEEES